MTGGVKTEGEFKPKLSRREFLKLATGGVVAGVTLGAVAAGVEGAKAIQKIVTGLTSEGKNVPSGETGLVGSDKDAKVASKGKEAGNLLDIMPTVEGWGLNKCLQAGVFCLDLTAERKIETVVRTPSSPQSAFEEDYDRFLVAQLVRSDGGDAFSLFNKISTEWVKAGRPTRVDKEQWLSILEEASPEAAKRWKEVDTIPPLDLPAPKGRKFEWRPSLIPQEILDIPEDEHRLIYWMARAKFNTPWPLDQGEAGGINWASKRIDHHLYENWFEVKVTSYNLNGPSEVGPEGSIPYISPSPYAGYPPLGRWIEP